MRLLNLLANGAALLAAPFAFADVPQTARDADVVILGEFHDNLAHHDTQATWINEIRPTAVIYEMLLPEEADRVNAVDRNDVSLKEALSGAHWTGIGLYLPLLLASDAPVIGAAQPREAVRAAFSEGAAALFGEDAGRFGLTAALPADQLQTRMEMQFASHCEAMPMEMMAGMVEAQRFRDAAFARVTLDALAEHGAPVVLVTGNGHARKDWGVPLSLAAAAPDVTVFALGQSETGVTLPGAFDLVLEAEPQTRDDPCRAFQ